MPKTRDNRCKRVIKNFFSEQLPNYHFLDNKINTRGWKLARYEIHVPYSWEVKEPEYIPETRSLVWNITEHSQSLPNAEKITEIEKNFKNKFECFEKKVHGRSTSFLRLYETNVHDEEVIFKLLVEYDKSHIPFPENNQENLEERVEQLERNNRQLLDQLRVFRTETERYIGPLRRRLHRALRERDEANAFVSTCENMFKMNNAKYMESYRNILRNCYKTMNKKHECPICYDPIENKDVFTTPCNHIVCNDCSKRCKNTCPMCRQEMAYFPEQFEQEEEMEFP